MDKKRKIILSRWLCALLAFACVVSLTACGNRRKTKENETLCLGVDVAKYQGTIHWSKVADSGVSFAMVRLGYRTAIDGVIVEDSNARYNLQEGSRAGLALGGYFYSTAITTEEAKEEARWVAELVARYPITFPIVYDCEGFEAPDSRQYSMTAQERTDVALAFLKEIHRLGYEGMFYASRSDLENQWQTERIEKKYKIWVAQYPELPYPQTHAPSYNGKYHMWQFTNDATISGIPTDVDLNLSYFSYDGIEPARDSEPPEEAYPDPEALMAFREVEETVTAKDLTNLRSIPGQGEDSKILYALPNGETVLRTAVSDSGWSRVIYNGQTCYAITSYLTTDLNYNPDTDAGEDDGLKTRFDPVNETVTAKDVVNLRTLPSVENQDSQIICQLENGQTATRTGISSNGWSELSYNGQTCYAVSSYLQLLDSSGNAVDEDSGEIKTVFEDIHDQVTAKERVNLRTMPSTEHPNSKVVATITSADTVQRTGINRDVGWSRVEWNGQTLYCITQYLKTAG